MMKMREISSCRRTQSPMRLLLSLIALVLVATTSNAQTNVTLDDTDMYIIYSPATSWHASTVPCTSCLAPDTGTAHDGTWHDGTHVIPTADEDDEPTVGDTDGDGTTTSSAPQATTSVTSTLISTFTSASSVQPAQTSEVDDDSGNNDSDSGKGKGKDGDGSGKKRLKRRSRSRSRKRSTDRHLRLERDSGETNPFETQGNDSDDPGFQDVPVTATLTFEGIAISLFAIIPLFPAPPNTTPTFTNLSFVLDGTPHGQFLHQPDPAQSGTPTVNSSNSEKYLSNFTVFSVSGLENMTHTLVVNVGVDSVFLFDYAVYEAGVSDPADPGSDTATAPGSQRTSASDTEDA
ncbi:hypothetical protein DFH11DRAFT_128047 [Phellopilus nigrolimitatus]|nr:hypothetical protein DFH11DRAFT_128047 [Phellopilus nigrolimitatus]